MAHPCRRVLVVEDDPDLLETLGEFLVEEGIEPILAASGEAALVALARRPLPDAILLDLTIPGISSQQLLQRLQQDPELCPIPVAAMSGLGPRQYQYLPHVTDFLQKPFDLERLNSALAALCSRRSHAATAG